MFEKLKKAGLYERSLVTITGRLVQRYNDCLSLLGVTPTSLQRFSIDAMGWSPEIAEEKQETYYLNNGMANVNAIIISPEQAELPVYRPSHSFDGDVIKAIFAAHMKTISDVTKDSAVCIHIDQHNDGFFDPFDLLHYQKITVRFEVLYELDHRQEEQMSLIEEFKEARNFIDRSKHDALLSHAKKYGDLRNRSLSLEPLILPVRSFYTKAFGGVYVLRDFIKEILIFEDEEIYRKAIEDTDHDVLLYHISHKELLETLVRHLILETDIQKMAKSKRYERIKKHRFVMISPEYEHPFDEILDSHFLFKKYWDALDQHVKKILGGVDRYVQKAIIVKDLKQSDFIDDIYMTALHEPHSALEEEQKALLWQLLSKMAPMDPVHLFWYDKMAFYEAYGSWPDSYQDWVIRGIIDNRASRPTKN